MSVDRHDWEAPGIRLTQSVMPDGDAVPPLSSALPAFIGGHPAITAARQTMNTSEVCFVPVATWAQWPWEYRPGEWCLADSVRHYFDNGGGPCFVLTAPQETTGIMASWVAWWDTFIATASMLLLREPAITLVAAPQMSLLPPSVGEHVEETEADSYRQAAALALVLRWKALLQACASRPDLFFVLDAPADPQVATACIKSIRGTNALPHDVASRVALYGPHLVTDYDKVGTLPPCGAVLGVYGRTDEADGVWKAPANEILLHVVKPAIRETLARDWFAVNQPAINLIRSFAGRGTRIWGCRTLSSEATFRYVQVRRTVTWIEANLKQICRFAVFEPNNEITWFQVRGLCRAWLRQMWLDGGLAGADETAAFTVRVGLNESMTAADIEAGRLVIAVGVSVLHAAEFIDMRLVLTVGDGQENGISSQGSRNT